MATKKISALTADASPTSDDNVVLVDDISGTPVTKRATIANVLAVSHSHSAGNITSGTLTHERGGLEADVSGYDGIVKISGGSTSAVTAPTGTLVGTSDSQTLTNKTINTASNTITVSESDISDLGTAATLNADTDVSGNSWVIDEDTMASNLATKVPTQQSVKAYVDANAGGTVDVVSNVATSTVLGRVTAGSGDSEELTATQVRTLINVEDGATADQTGAEIKAAYEAELDTNAYTDAEKSKLAAIEASADVTDATNVGTAMTGATAKTTPVDADTMPLNDSAASNVLKKVTWANVKATLKAYTDTLYSALGHTHTESDITDLGTYLTDITGENIADLSDVTVTTPADNEVLAYNTGTSTWINQTASEAGLAAASHSHATSDVTSGTFDNARIAESNVTQHQAALSITESQISDLDHDAVKIQGVGIDATVGTPSDGDILVYRSAGTDWVLEAKPAGGSNPAMSDITDVTITTVADNEVMAYDNGTSTWINQTAAEAGLAAASHTHTEADITDLGTYLTTISGESVGDLSDVTITTLGDGEILLSSSGTFINRTFGEADIASATTLSSHTSNTSNPHSVSKGQIGLNNVENLKVKLDGTTAPGVSDDVSAGYSVGSRWIDTTSDKEYVCLDSSAGAAVWTETTQSGSSPAMDDLTDVTITTIASGEILKWNGSAWVNNTLTEAGVAAASHTHTESEITDLGAYITASSTDTLTNKTINADNNTISNLAIGSEVSASTGADINLNGYNLQLTPTAGGADHTASGMIASVTVDTNATGVGAALYLAADGNYDEADASAASTGPCIALALETGTGAKKVLHSGYMRDDTWAWTVGGLIYLSETTGALTQTAPTTTGSQVQILGVATHADRMFFNPQLVVVENA